MGQRNSSKNLASACRSDTISCTQLDSKQALSINLPQNLTKSGQKILVNQLIHPWIVWGMATFFLFFQFLLQTTSAVIVKALMDDLRLTSIEAGILSSSFFYAYILWLIPAGLILDRYGSRTSLLFASGILSIGCFIFALSNTLILALVGRFFMGVGASFGFILTLYVIDIWFPQHYFAIMVGISETLSMSVAAISAVLLAWIVIEEGWRVAIFICGTVGFVFFPIALVFMPEHEKEISKISMKPMLPHLVRIIFHLKTLLKDRRIWLVGAYAFCVFALQNVFGSLWGIPFIMEAYGYKLNVATLTVMMIPIGIAIGGPIFSLISTKINQNRAVMLWASLIGFFLINIILYFLQLPHSILLLLILLCGACSGTYIQAFTIAKEVSIPGTRATVISLITLLTMASAAILQPFVGVLLHVQALGLIHSKVANFQYALAVLPICSFVAFIVALLIKEPIRET